jgi:hypothetical protein
VSGNNYDFPVFVSLINGQIANLSITQQVVHNLHLYYIAGNQTIPLAFIVGNVKPGSFTVTIYNITLSMAQSISSSQAVISAQSNATSGKLTSAAAGLIGPAQMAYLSNIAHAFFTPIYSFVSLYLIVMLAIIAFYPLFILSKRKGRRIATYTWITSLFAGIIAYLTYLNTETQDPNVAFALFGTLKFGNVGVMPWNMLLVYIGIIVVYVWRFPSRKYRKGEWFMVALIALVWFIGWALFRGGLL